jgi:sulfide:quinone oxidoreductase
MTGPKTIVVLGGGVGGIATARELRKRLPRQHRIILIDREQEHLFAPSLLWLMVGLRRAEAIKRPLSRLERKGIEVRQGEIEKINAAARRVTVAGGVIEADYLVVSLGAELSSETIAGLERAGHNFYTLSGAEQLRAALSRLVRGRIVILTAAPAYKCPAAPYEAALLINHYLHERGRGEAVTLDVYAAEPGPMGVAGPDVSTAVKQMLESKGIPYHPEHQVKAVDPVAKRIEFTNGAGADFDLLAYVPPHRAPRVVRESDLASESGWISVDRHTMETRFPGVYAIGDVLSIPLKLGKPLPKAGVFAHAQGEVVARNIVSVLRRGEAGAEHFNGYGECFIETGGGKAGFGSGDFYAEPVPLIKLRAPSRRWHLGKVLFEKLWLRFKL